MSSRKLTASSTRVRQKKSPDAHTPKFFSGSHAGEFNTSKSSLKDSPVHGARKLSMSSNAGKEGDSPGNSGSRKHASSSYSRVEEVLRERLSDCLDRITHLTEENDALHTQLQEIEQLHKHVSKLHFDAREEVNELLQKIAAKAEADSQNYQELASSLAAANIAKEKAESERDEAMEKLAESEEMAKETIEELKDLNERLISQIESERKMNLNRVEGLESQLARMQEQLIQSQKECLLMQETKKILEQSALQTKEELRVVKGREQDLVEKVHVRDSDSTKELQAVRSELESMKFKAQESKMREEIVQQECQRLKNELDQSHKKLASRETADQTLQSEIRAKEKQCFELQSEISLLTHKWEHARERLAQLEEYERSYISVSGAFESQKDEISTLREALEEAYHKIEEMKISASSLYEETNETRANLREKEETIKRLQEEANLLKTLEERRSASDTSDQAERNRLNEYLVRLQSSNQKLIARCQELEDFSRELEETAERTQREAADKDKESSKMIQELRSEKQAVDVRIDELQRSLKSVEDKNEQLQRSHSAVKLRLEEATSQAAEAGSLRKEVEKLRSALMQALEFTESARSDVEKRASNDQKILGLISYMLTNNADAMGEEKNGQGASILPERELLQSRDAFPSTPGFLSAARGRKSQTSPSERFLKTREAILEAIAVRSPEGLVRGAERRSESLDRLTRDLLNLPLSDNSEF